MDLASFHSVQDNLDLNWFPQIRHILGAMAFWGCLWNSWQGGTGWAVCEVAQIISEACVCLLYGEKFHYFHNVVSLRTQNVIKTIVRGERE